MVFFFKLSMRNIKYFYFASLLFFTTARFLVAGWVLLLYWYLFAIILIIRWVNYRISLKIELNSYNIFIILLSHILFFFFSFFQVDIGDGSFSVFFVKIVSIFSEELASILNEISYKFWARLQLILGLISFFFEIFFFFASTNLVK